MKIPNLPSWYHCGTWNFSSDDQRGANGPRATTASTWRTASATRASWGRAGEARREPSRKRAPRLVRRIEKGSYAGAVSAIEDAERALALADAASSRSDVDGLVAHLSGAIRAFTAAGDRRRAAMACVRL